MNYFECCIPCKPPKRYPGCSGSCPEYKKARAKFDADKAKERRTISLKYYANEKSTITKDNVAKYARRRPRRNRCR